MRFDLKVIINHSFVFFIVLKQFVAEQVESWVVSQWRKRQLWKLLKTRDMFHRNRLGCSDLSL